MHYITLEGRSNAIYTFHFLLLFIPLPLPVTFIVGSIYRNPTTIGFHLGITSSLLWDLNPYIIPIILTILEVKITRELLEERDTWSREGKEGGGEGDKSFLLGGLRGNQSDSS